MSSSREILRGRLIHINGDIKPHKKLLICHRVQMIKDALMSDFNKWLGHI